MPHDMVIHQDLESMYMMVPCFITCVTLSNKQGCNKTESSKISSGQGKRRRAQDGAGGGDRGGRDQDGRRGGTCNAGGDRDTLWGRAVLQQYRALFKGRCSHQEGGQEGGPHHLAEQTVSRYVLEEGQRGTVCRGGLGELQALGKRAHPRVGERMLGTRIYVVEFRGLVARGAMGQGYGKKNDGKWDRMVERLMVGGIESEYMGE